MGDIEARAQKQIRNGRVQAAILDSIAFAGILGVALVAPKALSLLERVQDNAGRRNVKSAAKRLADKGLLRLIHHNGIAAYELTAAGHRFIDKNSLQFKRPARWDGKWRIVTFDIVQARSAARNRLRAQLARIGFERLQDSVWVFPYGCEELLALLKRDFGLGKEVLYIVASSIENDRELRGRFGLK